MSSILHLRPKWQWERLGYRVKKNAVGILAPHIPTSEKNLHIRRVRLFDETQVYLADDAIMPERQKYKPLDHELLFWMRRVFTVGEKPRRGRPQIHARQMDKYKLKFRQGMIDDDFKEVAPRRRVIYPAQGLGLGRKKKQASERRCEACGKTLAAKRGDAKYCGSACRKWASRMGVTDKCK